MNDTGNVREDFALSKEAMPKSGISAGQDVTTNFDEDFGGFEFSKMDTEAIDGFQSFDEMVPKLSAFEVRLEAMGNDVDCGCNTDVAHVESNVN
jgi:hypothetical protein